MIRGGRTRRRMLSTHPEKSQQNYEGGIQMSEKLVSTRRQVLAGAGLAAVASQIGFTTGRTRRRPAAQAHLGAAGARRLGHRAAGRLQGFLRHGRLGVSADRQSELLGREPRRAGQQRDRREGGHHPHTAREPGAGAGVRARHRRGRSRWSSSTRVARRRRSSSGSASSARTSSRPAS